MELGTKKSSRGTSKFDDLVEQRKITETEKTKLIDEITSVKTRKIGYVKGLYESINPQYKPKGFGFEDLPDFKYGKGLMTKIKYKENQKGYFLRYHNSSDKSFIFSHGFLKMEGYKKLPSWVQDVKIPLVEGKGIPTQAYFTLRQMKLLNVPENGIKKIKMNQIQNLETMGYLTKIAKEKNISNFAKIDVIEAPSMNYVKTTMQQAGYDLKRSSVVYNENTFLVKISDLTKDFNITKEYLDKYGLSLDDKLLINFNIEIETINFKNSKR